MAICTEFILFTRAVYAYCHTRKENLSIFIFARMFELDEQSDVSKTNQKKHYSCKDDILSLCKFNLRRSSTMNGFLYRRNSIVICLVHRIKSSTMNIFLYRRNSMVIFFTFSLMRIVFIFNYFIQYL